MIRIVSLFPFFNIIFIYLASFLFSPCIPLFNKRSGAPLELLEIKDLWLLYIVYLGVCVDGWD
jgi:hypothetical protein